MTEKDAEKSLRSLGERVRAGWKDTHKISNKTRDAVRSAVQEDWEKSKSETAERAENAAHDRSVGKSQNKRKDHSHGH